MFEKSWFSKPNLSQGKSNEGAFSGQVRDELEMFDNVRTCQKHFWQHLKMLTSENIKKRRKHSKRPKFLLTITEPQDLCCSRRRSRDPCGDRRPCSRGARRSHAPHCPAKPLGMDIKRTGYINPDASLVCLSLCTVRCPAPVPAGEAQVLEEIEEVEGPIVCSSPLLL